MSKTPEVPVRPEMVQILQVLADVIASHKRQLDQAQANFYNYVHQCAEILKVDTGLMEFDAPLAAFVPRKTKIDESELQLGRGEDIGGEEPARPPDTPEPRPSTT